MVVFTLKVRGLMPWIPSSPMTEATVLWLAASFVPASSAVMRKAPEVPLEELWMAVILLAKQLRRTWRAEGMSL